MANEFYAPPDATFKQTQEWLNGPKGAKLEQDIEAIKSRLDNTPNINTLVANYNNAVGDSRYQVSSGVNMKYSASGQNNPTESLFTENDELLSRLVTIQSYFDPIGGIAYGNIYGPGPKQAEVDAAATALSSEADALVAIAESIVDAQLAFEEAKALDVKNNAPPVSATALMAAATSRGTSQLGKTPEQLKKEADDHRKKVQAQADAMGTAGAYIANKNYLSKAFQEQCFIQSNLFRFVKLQNASADLASHQKLPYRGKNGTNASITCNLPPFGFINTLTQSPSMASLFDIEPHVLSQLQPVVRLYKVSNEADSEEPEVEIFFDSSNTENDIASTLANKRRRGYGVGLKSFDWANEAGDAFAVKRSIRATLKIHASNMAELLRPRGGFRYADLALKTGKSIADTHPYCLDFGSDTMAGSASTLDFRLKAVVGYAIPNNLSVRGKEKEMLQAAIHDAFTTLELTPTIHTFDFDETGRVTFSIEYLAYVEDFFDDYYYDIFPNSADYTARIEEKAIIRTKEKNDTTPLQSSQPDRLKENQVLSLSALTRGLFKNQHIWFVRIPYGQLREAVINPTEAFPVYNTQGKLANLEEVNTSIEQMQGAIARVNADKTKTVDPEYVSRLKALKAAGAGQEPSDAWEQVSFFFLADLVDLILKNIGDALGSQTADALAKLVKKASENGGYDKAVLSNEQKTLKAMQSHFKRLRVVLGPIEVRENTRLKLTSDAPSTFSNISLGSVPISTKYFIEWMTQKMLAKNRSGYTLTSFLTDFMKSYVRTFLNSKACSGDSAAQKVSIFTSTVSSYTNHPSGQDELSAIIAMSGFKSKPADLDLNEAKYNLAKKRPGMTHPILNTMGSRISAGSPNQGQEKQKNYLILYGSRVQPRDLMTGNRAMDASRGIHHYMLGASRGLVKNITLEKTQVKGHKEMRFEQEGYDGLLQLREVYNVVADTFLMPNAYPGTYMFVDPRGFAPDTRGFEFARGKSMVPIDQFELSRYGIGGYYVITKTEHRIAEGEASTRVQAAWTAQIIKAGSSPPSSAEPAPIESNPTANVIRKCGDNRSNMKLTFPDQVINAPGTDVPEDDVGLPGYEDAASTWDSMMESGSEESD